MTGSNFLVRGGADFSAIKAEMKKTQNALGGFQKGIESGMRKIAAAFSIRAAVNFAKESRDMYKEVAQNESKLATVMRSRMGASDAAIKDMLGFIDAEQRLGVVGADAMKAGAQELATYLTDVKSLKGAIPILNNIATQQYGVDVTASQLQQTATMVGKVLDGQLGGLSRWGYSWTEAEERILMNGTAQQKVAALAEVVTQSIGDMNHELAKTDVGQQKQLANTMSDVRTQFGAAVNQILVLFIPALKMLAEWFGKIAQYARAAAQAVANFFGKKADPAVVGLGNDTENATGKMEDFGDGVKDAAQKTDKALGKFDDLDRLISRAADNADDAAENFDSIGNVGKGFDFGIQADVDTSGIEGFVEKMLKWLQPLSGLFYAVKDALIAVWDALAPFRAWLTDALLGFIWLLIDALRAFADWARANPEVIANIAEIILGFLAGLWVFNTVKNIIGFVSNLVNGFMGLGKVIITTLSSPLNWVIIALGLIIAALVVTQGSLKDLMPIIETIIIIAGSFAAAWALVNVAITAWNFIAGVATAVTAAFGAAVAFLTSPIGIVTIAIGAVIAIVLLLMRHFGVLGEVAGKVWEFIKGIIGGIAKFFESIGDFIGGIFGLSKKSKVDINTESKNTTFGNFTMQPIPETPDISVSKAYSVAMNDQTQVKSVENPNKSSAFENSVLSALKNIAGDIAKGHTIVLDSGEIVGVVTKGQRNQTRAYGR